jgi:hypothetical protein
MANLTLKIDDALLRDAKVLAASRGTSVSRLVAEQLELLVCEHKCYEAAKRRAVQRLRKGFDLGWRPPASRDELHRR